MATTQQQLAGKTAFTAYTKIIRNELERLGYSASYINDYMGEEYRQQSAISRMPFYDAINYWHKAETLTRDPLFALKAAYNVHPADFGPLGLLTTHCKTVGQAWQLAYKYQFLVADGFNSELIIAGDQVINRTNCLGVSPEWSRPYVEHDFISLLMILRYATANLRPDIRFEIHMRHKASAPVEEYQQVFDADYRFEMEHDQIIFPHKVLDLPVYSANKDIFEFLSNKVSSIFNASRRKNCFHLDVERYMEEQILTGRQLSLEACSSHFHVSSSTFKRRLTEHETSYQQLLDTTKLKIARTMLENQATKISRIAHLLGYSGTSQFTRFMKSHTGLSPVEYRKQRH